MRTVSYQRTPAGTIPRMMDVTYFGVNSNGYWKMNVTSIVVTRTA